jgi:hypothetical protein
MSNNFALFALIAIFTIWLVALLKYPFNSAMTWGRRRAALASQRANQKKSESQQKREEVARRTEVEQLSQFRREHPAQIVGVPDLARLSDAITALKNFVAKADAYRPKFTLPYDTKVREVRFSFPFEFFFHRDDSRF